MRHDGDAGELVQPFGGAARSAPLLDRPAQVRRAGASTRGTDVTVRAGGLPGWAELEITDYVAGIPAGLAGKIFEPRVGGTTDVAGTGLGLPIARGIVEAHGGTLVATAAHPGTSFVVALPADPPPGSTGEPAGASWSAVEEPEEERGG